MLEHFPILNINTNQTLKEQYLNFVRSSHLFWEQREMERFR